jgi:hypothetical protein
MWNVGDRIDVSQVFAVYREAVVEEIFTKKNGSLYLKVRGVLGDGTLSKTLHNVWTEEITSNK